MAHTDVVSPSTGPCISWTTCKILYLDPFLFRGSNLVCYCAYISPLSASYDSAIQCYRQSTQFLYSTFLPLASCSCHQAPSWCHRSTTFPPNFIEMWRITLQRLKGTQRGEKWLKKIWIPCQIWSVRLGPCITWKGKLSLRWSTTQHEASLLVLCQFKTNNFH